MGGPRARLRLAAVRHFRPGRARVVLRWRAGAGARAGQRNYLVRADFRAASARGRLVPRPLQRACLEAGLKLDINRAIRGGWITPGAHTRTVLQWATRPAWTFTANMTGTKHGYVRVQIESLDDWIELEARPRHF